MRSNENKPSCPSDQNIFGRCIYQTTRPTFSDTGPFLFTDTAFLRCSIDGNGSAISFSISGGKLAVIGCTFAQCISYTSGDDGNGGGAIYANGVAKIEVSFSSFISCACYSTDGCDGGAIEIYKLTSQPMITQCIFLLCHADDDGGTVSVFNSSSDNTLVCTDCRIIHCTVPLNDDNRAGPTSGGIVFWYNDNPMNYANILFTDSEGMYGGAYSTDNITVAPDYLLRYCFFNRNRGPIGNDIYLSPLSSIPPFLHCISTSEPGRIGYWNDTEYTSTDADWLSLTLEKTKDTQIPNYSHFLESLTTLFIMRHSFY